MRACPLGEVYAVEMKDEALTSSAGTPKDFTRSTCASFPAALEVLLALPAPDAVFLGGTTGEAEAIVELLRGLQSIRLVATAVTMESAQALLRLMRPMVDFEARQVAASASNRLGAIRCSKRKPGFHFQRQRHLKREAKRRFRAGFGAAPQRFL
ncbi:MAG: hypothetical protein ACLUMK_11650 [Christensenellales bacterium]